MKILHIIGGMDRGGAELYIMNTLRNIDRKKFHCDILTFMPPRDGKEYVFANELKELGVKIIKVEDNRFRHPRRFMRDVENVLRDGKYDAVHSHIDFMSCLTLSAARKAGVEKRFSHSHSTNNSKINNVAMKLVCKVLRRGLNRNVTTRLACGKDAGEFLYGKGKPFTIIRNGIDLQKFRYNANTRRMMRAKYDIDEEAIVFLNIGRFEAVKNQEQLINIFADYYRKDKRARLVIIGEGSLEQNIRDKIASERLQDVVLLLPSQDNVECFYSMSDIFLLPSLFEGVPTVGIEAQANGMKCLFSANVPSEAKLIDDTEFISLEDNWTSHITISGRKRGDAFSEPSVQAYNIENTVLKLEEVYSA